jgi:hypothetical protein
MIGDVVLVMGRRRRQRFVRRKFQRRMTAGHERDRKGMATAYKPIERDATERRVTAEYGDTPTVKRDCAARTRGRPRTPAMRGAKSLTPLPQRFPDLPWRAGSFL